MRIPDHLVIYPSDNCNLTCSYCYAGKGRGSGISKKDLFRAIAYFASLPGGAKKVTFLGGEPLLDRELLFAAVTRIRKIMPSAPIAVFTNGTLLDGAAVRFLTRKEAKIIVSLDGAEAANDASRRFKTSKASVFKTVIGQIGEYTSVLTAAIMVSPGSAGALAANLSDLLKLGFKSIAWAPDVTALWSAGALADLKKSCLELKRDYLAGLKAGRIYEIANAYEFLEDRSEGEPLTECSSLILGPDGSYYPCDKIIGAPGCARWKVRDPYDNCSGAGAKVDFFRKARGAGARCSRRLCAVGAWGYARYKAGITGAGLTKIMRSQAAVRRIVLKYYEDLFRIGLAYPAFRRAHGLPPKPGSGREYETRKR